MINKPLFFRVLQTRKLDNKRILETVVPYLGIDTSREQTYPAHALTQSVILKMSYNWKDMTSYELEYSRHLLPLLGTLVEDLKDTYTYKNFTLFRALFVVLPAGATIHPHTDNGESFHKTHRIHYALKTNKDVDFIVDGVKLPFMEHPCIEINNLALHSVVNNGTEDRVHLIVDVYDKDNC